MKKTVKFVLLAGLMLLSACAPIIPAATEAPTATGTPSQPPPPATTETPAEVTPEITPPPVSVTDLPSASMVQLSIAALDEKFNLASEAVTVTEVIPMTWPDAGLGCPKKGVLYAQVLTPGFQILLEADGHVFTFHTDSDDTMVLCSVEPPDEIYLKP